MLWGEFWINVELLTSYGKKEIAASIYLLPDALTMSRFPTLIYSGSHCYLWAWICTRIFYKAQMAQASRRGRSRFHMYLPIKKAKYRIKIYRNAAEISPKIPTKRPIETKWSDLQELFKVNLYFRLIFKPKTLIAAVVRIMVVIFVWLKATQ